MHDSDVIPIDIARSSIRRLYVSHFLSAWGGRLWEFAVALLLAGITPDSILLTALFGLMESLAVVAFGGEIGQYVKKNIHDRVGVVRKFLIVQNTSIAACALCILGLLIQKNNVGSFFGVILAVMVVLLGSVARVAALGSTIAIEKDWVARLCKADENMLAEANSGMRRIDLTCKTLAPFFAAIVIQFSDWAGAIFIACWNVISMYFEYSLIMRVYEEVKHLQTSQPPIPQRSQPSDSLFARFQRFIENAGADWRVYRSQQVYFAAQALANLYFTVLSFGTLMTVFLLWCGIPGIAIGACRGTGAIFGLAATWAYPKLHRKYGVVVTGKWAVFAQLACICLGIPCIFYTLNHGNIDDGSSLLPLYAPVLLIIGVVVSRIFLWIFDLAVSQLLQSKVSDDDRAPVNGSQQSMQQFMQMAVYLLGVIISRPGDFGVLLLASLIMVASACVCYTVFAQSVPMGYSHALTEEEAGSDSLTSPASVKLLSEEECVDDTQQLNSDASNEETFSNGGIHVTVTPVSTN